MKQIGWVGTLSAVALVATGVAAWAAGSGSEWAVHGTPHSLVAGQDLTGVSAPPGRTNGTADEGEASKASGPPYKSLPQQARGGASQTGIATS
ncbi:hypothetical protein N234_10635 [Ralstonia pickettii DTP0602]|nr:hypothetical protein N234_10635 [Ralstonia pickettii DTP0602]